MYFNLPTFVHVSISDTCISRAGLEKVTRLHMPHKLKSTSMDDAASMRSADELWKVAKKDPIFVAKLKSK